MYPDESVAQRELLKRLALANIEAAPSFPALAAVAAPWLRSALLERRINQAFHLQASCL
jgi:hypothetical protein